MDLPITDQSDYRALGDLRPEVYRSVLQGAGSPLLPYVDAIRAAGLGITGPLLIHADVESGLGKTGRLGLRNYLGLRPYDGYTGPTIDLGSAGLFIDFSSPDAVAAEYKRRLLIETTTYKQGIYADKRTIRDVITTYAPPSENDTEGYITHFVADANAWYTLQEQLAAGKATAPTATPQPTPGPSDAWQPVILNITDAAGMALGGISDRQPARWDPSKSELQYLLSRCFPDRGGFNPAWIVFHVQQGMTKGSLPWWVNGQDNAGNPIQASATITLQRDGSLLRVIPEGQAPWTNGDVIQPTALAQELLATVGSQNANLPCLTIEAEDDGSNNLTAAQYKSLVWQVKDWRSRYSHITLNRLLPHAAINSQTRAFCGLYYSHVLALVGGAAPTSAPQYATADIPDFIKNGVYDGSDRALAGKTAYALNRIFTADAGTPVKQYAAPSAADLRAPLAANEEIYGLYGVKGDDNKYWVITQYGSRIPMAGLHPQIDILP